VSYDTLHRVWLLAYLGLVHEAGSPDVLVSRSIDGGRTWNVPVVVDGSGRSSSTTNDKTWITCDAARKSRFYGHCYLEYTTCSAGGRIQVSTPVDGGRGWSSRRGGPSNDAGQGGQPVTQPDGTVVVPYVDVGGVAIRSFRSTDGGATWSAPVDVVQPLVQHV